MSEPRGGQRMALKSLGAQPVPHLQPQHLVVVMEGCREGGSLKSLTLEPGPGRRVLPSGEGGGRVQGPGAASLGCLAGTGTASGRGWRSAA